jgi:hypothetical protein
VKVFSRLPKNEGLKENKRMKILYLFLILLSNSAIATNQLTLYFLPSPHGTDWSTPKNLAWSVIKNRFSHSNRFDGHSYVELECQEQKELSAVGIKDFDYLHQIFLKGRGLGIFFHGFKGQLEEKKVIENELQEYLRSGEINFARFILNQGQCERILTYLKEFKSYNVARHYGLAHRPLFGEGSTSAAYAVSFLEVADILDQEFIENWQNSVNIPLPLLGPPVKEETVGWFKLLVNANQWSPENSQHKTLAFWDLDRMHQWVYKKINSPLPGNTSLLKIHNAQGIVLDKTAWPVPKKPIWLQHTDQVYSKTDKAIKTK